MFESRTTSASQQFLDIAVTKLHLQRPKYRALWATTGHCLPRLFAPLVISRLTKRCRASCFSAVPNSPPLTSPANPATAPRTSIPMAPPAQPPLRPRTEKPRLTVRPPAPQGRSGCYPTGLFTGRGSTTRRFQSHPEAIAAIWHGKRPGAINNSRATPRAPLPGRSKLG